MSWRLTIGRRALVLALFAAIVGGCATDSIQEFDRDQEQAEARHLYEPLAASPEGLLQQFRSEDRVAAVFELSAKGAERYPVPMPEELYWDENKAVFFKLESEDESVDQPWLYFNGRKLRIEKVDRPFAQDGDLVASSEEIFSVYRSIPVFTGGMVGTGNLEIFRYDFAMTSEGDLESVGHVRMTSAKGSDLHPMPISGTDAVVYLHEEADNRRVLMLVDDKFRSSRPLLAAQEGDVLFPSLLSDGRLAFVSDELGYYSLFQLNDVADYVAKVLAKETTTAPLTEPFRYPFPRSAQPDELYLGSMSKDGAMQPVLFSRPDELNLETIINLVRAHNPAINQRRARYTAALLEAAQFRLNNYPRLDFGLSWDNAVEVFDNTPTIFTGDTVTKEIFRVFLGLTQPITEFKRNKLFTEGALKDAEVALHVLTAETNNRITEAAELYFEATYLTRRIAIETEQLAVTEKRADYFRTLREKHESTRLQIMAVDQVRVGLLSERSFHEDRLAYLVSRLKEVMGLPRESSLTLAQDRFQFDRAALPSLEEALHIAQLNHPGIQAAASAVASAYYQRATGSNIRPSAAVSANYEHRNREFHDRGLTPAQAAATPDTTSDEVVGLALTGQIPLASMKARRLHRDFWGDLMSAFQLAEDAEIRRVKTAVEEAYMDFRAAQRDGGAKQASQAYFLEKLRVSRLHREFGAPSGSLGLLRPPDEPGAVEESLSTGVLAPLTAEYEFLRALDKAERVEMDLGIRMAHAWREMGVIDRFIEDLDTYKKTNFQSRRPSVWLWKTRDHLETDDALDGLIAKLKSHDTRRVYAYLYSAAELLTDRQNFERFTLFVELCNQWGIEVWALLGEPEWIESNNAAEVSTAIERILEFNARFATLEPKIAGIKLDLEPHSLPGWNDDEARHAKLQDHYINLLATARISANGALPLWADVPVKFFHDDESALRGQLERHLDGVTLMAYFDNENAIQKWARIALDGFEKPVEIGVEFSTAAPAADSIATWSPERVDTLRATLMTTHGSRKNYAGMAYHDYEALAIGPIRE